MTIVRLLLIALILSWSACRTNYDPNDQYVRGLRSFDHKDYNNARELWEPLVKEGDCDAEFRLGFLYFFAYGVDRDVQKTLSLWTSAANRGQPRAQAALGDVYFKSEKDTQLFCRIGCEGVSQDLVAAYKWYLLAEQFVAYDNDKRYIARVLPRIRAQLSAQQKSEGEKAASEWKPAPVACKPRKLP